MDIEISEELYIAQWEYYDMKNELNHKDFIWYELWLLLVLTAIVIIIGKKLL